MFRLLSASHHQALHNFLNQNMKKCYSWWDPMNLAYTKILHFTLGAKFCQFDSVIMFMASGAGGTHNSVVTPSLISAHVRLTVTPRNTLPHRHTTTELFFRKPTQLRNRHSFQASAHRPQRLPCQQRFRIYADVGYLLAFGQWYFHAEG
jgi:hypothetical protein